MKAPWLTYTLVGVNIVMFALISGGVMSEALVLDSEVLSRLWTLLGYGFAHTEPLHLAVNMVVLAVACRWLERHVSRWLILSAYVGGTLAGGLVFVGLNALAGGAMQLCGASAAVLALAAMTAQARREVRVEAFGRRISVRAVSYVLVAVIVVSLIFGGNTGGNAAHLAGVAVGMVLGRRLMQAPDTEAIKAKVERSGYASLSESERSTLFNQTKKK
ncbi:MAG: rhomboid family intramembrane serine protease [Muribaculaceae bacterium]